MSLLLWMLAGLVVGGVVYTVYVSNITKSSALQAAKSKMNSDELRKAFKAKVKDRTTSSIKLDVLDSMSNSICEVDITGEYVASDIRRGDVLTI